MFPSILIQLENGPNEFYFYFYFVLRHLLVAKKICKKNKKNDGLNGLEHNTEKLMLFVYLFQ